MTDINRDDELLAEATHSHLPRIRNLAKLINQNSIGLFLWNVNNLRFRLNLFCLIFDLFMLLLLRSIF